MTSMVSAISARGTVTTLSWISCSMRRRTPSADSGVDRADAAGMAGAPRLEQVERFGTAHLADRDAVGPQAQGRADQVGERGNAVLGAQRHEVGRGALQLARVLDQDYAIVGLGDFSQQRVGQGGLAGRRAASDQDVLPGRNGANQRVGLPCRHDLRRYIILEREHRDGGLADRKTRRCHHRRQQTFEALAGIGKLGRHARRLGMNLGSDMMRHQPDDPLAIGSAHPAPRIGDPGAEPVDPQPPVGIEHDLDDRGIFKPSGNLRPERSAQHARSARRCLRLDGDDAHELPRVGEATDHRQRS